MPATRVVNITMPVFNRPELTLRTIESVARLTDHPLVLTVVDNGSDADLAARLLELHAAGAIHKLFTFTRNMGVASAVNLGWQRTEAAYYLKLDNDIEILRPDWLSQLVETADAVPEVGVVAYRFVQEKLCRAARTADGRNLLLTSGCNGACVLVRRDVRERLGYFCEDYGMYGEEDADFGYRIQLAGLLNAYLSDEGMVRQQSEPAAVRRYDHLKRRTTRQANFLRFLTNKHCYREGIRPLRVERKFESVPGVDGRYTQRTDKTYLRLSREWAAHTAAVRSANEGLLRDFANGLALA